MALPGPSTQKAHMVKKYLLALMRLLSALESWSFSATCALPDYLHEDISRFVTLLEGEVAQAHESRRAAQAENADLKERLARLAQAQEGGAP